MRLIPWNKNKINIYSKETIERIRNGVKKTLNNPMIREKMSKVQMGRKGYWTGKKHLGITGELHPRWKGGYKNELAYAKEGEF